MTGAKPPREKIVLPYKIYQVFRDQKYVVERVSQNIFQNLIFGGGGYPKTFFQNPIFGGGYLKEGGVSIVISGDRA